MKKCSYCGRENADDVLNCRECGTEFERPSEVLPPEEPEQPEPLPLEPASGALVGMKSIASLEVDFAVELLERLKKEGIPVEVKTGTQEGGLEYSDIMVEEGNYQRACDVAEAWEAEQRAEAEKRSNRFCPRCGSRHLENVGNDTVGSIWKCKDCGNDFAK